MWRHLFWSNYSLPLGDFTWDIGNMGAVGVVGMTDCVSWVYWGPRRGEVGVWMDVGSEIMHSG